MIGRDRTRTMAATSIVDEQDLHASGEQRFVLRGVDWSGFRTLAEALGERRVRLAYDGESLELMTVSRIHEKWSRLFGRLIVALTEELGLPIDSAGSPTLDREDVRRGLEPDECFYLQNEPLVRAKDDIDLAVDPPPDLAIEIDISQSSLNRLQIYQALAIPEVWRFDGQVLEIHRRGPDGRYALAECSGHFPFLPLSELVAFLQQHRQMDENSLIRSFRVWIRELVADG